MPDAEFLRVEVSTYIRIQDQILFPRNLSSLVKVS